MTVSELSRLKEIFEKMISALSDEDTATLFNIIRDINGSGSVIIEDEQEPPIVDIEPVEVRQLTGYRYEASDSPDHVGEFYFMSPAFMRNKIQSVLVGQEQYHYVMDWQGCELWYGKPSLGIITVKFKNGAIYRAAETAVPEEPLQFGNKEILTWFGRHNGDRGTWYARQDMSKYPPKFYLTVDGCLLRAEIINNGSRFEIGGQAGFVIKQSDVPGRTLAVICPQSCRSKNARIEY